MRDSLASGAGGSAPVPNEGGAAGAPPAGEGGVRYQILPGFPETLPDGRKRTRVEIRSADDDIWKYRCFQPDRFTDLSDPSAPAYDDDDWGHIEFDVIEPHGGPTPATPWLVLLEAGGMSLALEQDAPAGLDAALASDQDTVIMPWPGSQLAEGCGGTPERCRLKRQSVIPASSIVFAKLNERGLWRTKADNQWRGASDDYEDMAAASIPNNPLGEFVRDEKQDWGILQVSGCARDDAAGDRTAGPSRDREPWGYDGIVAALEYLQANHTPGALFFSGASSGGVTVTLIGTRLEGFSFSDRIAGYLPDAGAADYAAFQALRDVAHDDNGWLYLEERGFYVACQPPEWTFGEVFDGVLRHAQGFRAQDHLAGADGSCAASVRGLPCYNAPVLFGTTSRDIAIICGSDAMFDAVYRPSWDAVKAAREAGLGWGNGFYLNDDDLFEGVEALLCESSADVMPDCASSVASPAPIEGGLHTVKDLADYQLIAVNWMECVLAAGEDAASLHACARNCFKDAGQTQCLCGPDDDPTCALR